MAKDIYKNDPVPQEPQKKAGKEVVEENPATHLEPYPTGNPPDPVEIHKEIHPEMYRDDQNLPPEGMTTRTVKPPPYKGDETQSKKGK